MAPTPTGASEPNLGSGGFSSTTAGGGTPRTPVSRGSRIGISVGLEGLTKFESLTAKIRDNLKNIRESFTAINQQGRAGGTALLGGLGSPGVGGGGMSGVGGGGGGFGNFVARMAVGGGVANAVLDRSTRNMMESIPIYARSAQLSSMYGNSMPYLQVERQRLDALGQYAGDRQSAMAAEATGLRYGQTTAQNQTYMQGLGRMVQASGGTMNVAQAAQAGAGFLDPMVMRRQQAMGMQTARVGGQVRDTMTVAQDYIKNFESTRNNGRKLNEFDFINMQAPGSPIRVYFQQTYGLDDGSIDLIVQAGMQTVRAGGNLNYGSSSSISAGLGTNSSQLGLQAAQTMTVRSGREAQFAGRQADNFVNLLGTDQTIQKTLGEFEDQLSSVVGTLTNFERVLKGMLGLGAVGLGGMMLSGRGGMGGGGLLGGMMGMGGGGMFGGMGGGMGMGMGGGGMGMGGGILPGPSSPYVPGGPGIGGMLSRSIGPRGGAMGGMLNIAAGGMAVQQAVNATNWGDIFGAGAAGAVAGARFGPMGAVAGGALGLSAAGVMTLVNDARGREQERSANMLSLGISLPDDRLLQTLNEMGIGTYGSSSADAAGTSGHSTGMFNAFQLRRGTLISDFLGSLSEEDKKKLANYISQDGRHYFASDVDARSKFNEMSQFFGNPSQVIDDSRWKEQAVRGVGNVVTFQDVLSLIDSSSVFSSLRSRRTEYFGEVNPFDFVEINTAPYTSVLDTINTSTTSDASTGDATFSTGDAAGVQRSYSDNSWQGLDPRMKTRLKTMFEQSGGQVWLGGGGGTRSSATQEAMFRDRYRPDPNGEIEWNGQRWKHVKGAAAAPPGRSFHEVGLAADLQGPGVNNGWLKANAARFGLKEFSQVNNEPWHVQLAELPNSRSQYEKAGGATAFGSSDVGVTPTESSGGGAATASSFSGIRYSLLDTLASSRWMSSGSGLAYSGTAGETTGGPAVTAVAGQQLTGEQVANLAYQAGFRGQGLIDVVAISKRESSWNSGAFNGNTSTGDRSYGLMQLNMLGNLGPARLQAWGLTSEEQLFDPLTNLRAAFQLSQGGTNFHHWGGYKGMSDTYNTNVSSAAEVVRNAGLGDGPFAATGGGGAGGLFKFDITIQASGNLQYDTQQFAAAIRAPMEQIAAEIGMKRNS